MRALAAVVAICAFLIAGVTTVAGQGNELRLAGTWKTNWGTMELKGGGTALSGTYSHQDGQIRGTLTGSAFVGYWAQSDSGQECDDTELGSRYWGRFSITFAADGKRFEGSWGYCDDGVNRGSWTGEREVVDCADKDVLARERKLYAELRLAYSQNRLPRDVAEGVALRTGPNIVPTLEETIAAATKLAATRVELQKSYREYYGRAVSYIRSWVNLQRGVGTGPSADDHRWLADNQKKLAVRAKDFNNSYAAIKNPVTTEIIWSENQIAALSSLINKLKDDYANLQCVTGDELKKLLDDWAGTLRSAQDYRRRLPNVDDPLAVMPDTIEQIMVPVRERAKKDLEASHEFLRRLGVVIEVAHIESFLMVKAVEAIFGP